MRFFFQSSFYQRLLISCPVINSRNMSNYPKVYVRHLDSEETMKICFNLSIPEVLNRNFTFMRPKTEELSTTLSRMSLKITERINNKFSKKKKKKLPEDIEHMFTSNISINLYKNDELIDGSVTNIYAWTENTQIKINDTLYEVEENPPTVLELSLPKSIMAGFPVYPKIKLEFCTKEQCEFNWYKTVSCEIKEKNVKIGDKDWLHLSNEFFYITKESDVGSKLKISCLPKSKLKSGLPENTISPNTVETGPAKCPFEDRHLHTAELTNLSSLRCVSYNILADLYADSETARNDLFPYCPTDVLMLDYRKQLYLKEIMGYNADIICLQEVDRKVFHGDLTPVLSSIDLEGIYSEKGGQVVEGLACFYRNTKFRIIESNALILSDAVKTEPVLEPILKKLSENENLLERFMNRTTALQVVLLESLYEPQKRILIGNTHLYFHPKSDNIRLLQGTTCLLYLQNLLKKYQKEQPLYTSLIFCGDFNSSPDVGFYNLTTTNTLSEHCIDWQSNPDEIVDGMGLNHTLSLGSACGTPEYTNYTAGFVGCLDYIFYDKTSLDVAQVVSFPKHEDVIRHTALPSKIFPSDHIALVCTLKWK